VVYRDEHKLFAVIGVIIVAALIALLQISAERSGTTSPLTAIGSSILATVQNTSSAVSGGIGGAASTLLNLPHLTGDNHDLAARNDALTTENARLHELIEAYKQDASLQPEVTAYPKAIAARAIGFPPENDSRTITIDRGSQAGVRKDDGVLANGGVVGIVADVGPLSSHVLLITDYTSRLPAVVQRGRWWGIARGNLSSVRMEYVSQDAPLKIGDVIVTGEARSFHSGAVIGTVTAIERGDAVLYQTAVVKPAVNLGAIDRVIVVPK
jgi:rod shape-determining protein MreC